MGAALYRLGDGCRVKHGFAFRGEAMKESSDASLPVVVNIGNFKYDGGFRFESTRVQRYSGEFPDSFMLASGDLLLVMTCQTAGGEILGIPGRIPNDGTIYLHNQRMGRVEITRPDELDLSYLYYLFLSKTFNQHLVATSTGSKILHTAPGRIEDFTWQRPPVEEQRRIAAVLSAYDDLIENNARRIRVLEEMARALYREWFVQFRYPGHTLGTTGLPAGWEKRTLIQCAKFLSGGTPSKARADFWRGDLPWVSSGELTGMHVRHTTLNISEEGAEDGSRVVPAGTILAVVRGMSLAKEFRLGMTARTMSFNQDLKAIVPEPGIDNLMLFHALDTQRDEIRQMANEASHGTKKLDTPVLSKVLIAVPPAAIQHLFREHVAPLHAQWDNLDQRNRALRAARDLLLPKLLSGQLSVERIPDPAEAAG